MSNMFSIQGRRVLFSLALSLASFTASQSQAAIYFRGKEVLNGGKFVVDIEKMNWVGDCPIQDTDRIMAHVQVRSNTSVSRLMIVMQIFDTKGEVITTFSVSPKTCGEHPSDAWRKPGGKLDGANRFPFCGVVNPLVDVIPANKRLEAYKDGEKAWFYADFKRERQAQSIRVVNVVVDGKEVQYNVRFAGNRLMRVLSQPSAMKHSTEATFGSESSCRNWIPKDANASGSSNSKPGATYGGGNTYGGNSTYGGGNTYGGNKTYGGGNSNYGGGNTYGGNTYGGNTYGGGNSNYGGGNTYGGNKTYGGNNTYGNNTYGNNTYGGNTYGGNAYGGNAYGGGQNATQRQQPQGQQSWNTQGQNSYTVPEPSKVELVPGRKVRIAEAQAGDIVILQYADGLCGATMTHRKSPDEEDARIRPLLYSENSTPGGADQGGAGVATKTSLTLDFGTKTKPQVIEVQQAASYWMELRESAMGIVSYKVWLIPVRDKYRFYASPQGKQLKPQGNQGYQSY